MSHDIEINKNGTARFAYSSHEVPWHRLGTPMKGLQSMEAMLQASNSDYDVLITKVAAIDDDGNLIRNPDGSIVPISDSRATVRQNTDGSFDALATVGTRYEVRQNRQVLERALAVVGASGGDAVIDTCGTLKSGARFFATIDLGALVIDPAGIGDKIGRYLVVSSGHDGIWPVRYANTDIRAVCRNTVIMGLEQAQRVFTARHTRNMDEALEDARTVLHISTQWSLEFEKMAERMLRIHVDPRSGAIDKVLNKVFPAKPHETERQRKHREHVFATIFALYENSRNAGRVGSNGWALFNSVVEYLDHYRETTPDERAAASMDDNSVVTRKKIETQGLVLALA